MIDDILKYTREIIAGLAAGLAGFLGFITYRRSSKIRQLEEENEYLKKKIDRVTSKVDPESDRRLIEETKKSLQILDINALGLLHHAREELINFLKDKKRTLQIMLLNPESSMFRERVHQEDDCSHRLLSEWTTALTIIKDIEIHSGRQVDLRLFTDPPDRYLLVADALDGLSEHSRMLINYYPEQPGTRGYSGEQFLSEYICERDRDSFLKNNEYINVCLKRSRPVEVDVLLAKFLGEIHS